MGVASRQHSTLAVKPRPKGDRAPLTVERLWARLKEWRAVATRYEKTKASFLGVLCLAATTDWLKA
jgi:transposase